MEGRKKKETEREERKKETMNEKQQKRKRHRERKTKRKRKTRQTRQDRLTDKKKSQIAGLSDAIASSSREAGAGRGGMAVKTACCSELEQISTLSPGSARTCGGGGDEWMPLLRVPC